MEATGYSPSITRSPITLWVEDNLTKQYLLKVWQDEGSLIDIRLGGGKDVIKGIIHDQWEQGTEKHLDLLIGISADPIRTGGTIRLLKSEYFILKYMK